MRFSYYINRLSAEIAELKEENEKLRKHSGLSKENRELLETNRKLRVRLSEEGSPYSELQREKKELEETLVTERAQKHKIATESKKKSKVINDYKEQLAMIQRSTDDLHENREVLEANRKLRARLAKEESPYSKLRKEKEVLEDILVTERAQRHELERLNNVYLEKLSRIQRYSRDML